MVKIEDITVENLHRKLKKGKIKKLVKEVFGEDISIREFAGDFNIAKKFKLYNFLILSLPKSFLRIDSYFNKFNLSDLQYFDKTKELAEKYENFFGEEVTLRTPYSKLKNEIK